MIGARLERVARRTQRGWETLVYGSTLLTLTQIENLGLIDMQGHLNHIQWLSKCCLFEYFVDYV